MTRPRTHPAGSTASDRKAASNKRLIDAGGAVKQFRLSRESVEAIAAIREACSLPSDTAAVERALALVRNADPKPRTNSLPTKRREC
jgi:hypothetical protein